MLLLPLMLLLQHAATAPPQEPAVPSWNNFRAAVNQQSLHTVLVSIEERLRALDTLYSPRYTPRWEISIEQQSRRMETIESRLGRLETLLELRLDKLSETMSARQLKEELSRDQINRKLDSTYERLNHRLSYLEARLDVSVAKLQSTIDTGVGRMERLEATAAGRQGDIEAELADIETGIDEIKKHVTAFEEQHNRSLVTILENGKQIATEMDNLTTLVEDLHVEFNKTQAVSELNDDQGTNHQEALRKNMNLLVDKVISGIDKNANNFITKVLEGLVKDSMSLSNATRRELQDGIRSIAVQMGRRGLVQSDRDRQEGSMDIALDTLGLVQRRLNELGRKFDSSFQMLMLAQNLFLESCHRIQLDEPQLEMKLTKVLERILDAITNRSVNTDCEVQTLQEVFKSHSSHLTRILNQATNKILQASEQNNEDSKLLQLSIASVKDHLLESNKYIVEAITDIKEEEATGTERLFNIAASLQELQESVAEISTSNKAAKQERDKYKDDVGDCPDSEQLVVEILAELKRNGITINHKTAKENTMAETNTGKDIEIEFDRNDLSGTEEGFGEENAEAIVRNTGNSEAESTLLQIIKPPENVSEAEETLMENAELGLSTRNTNLTLNSSSFQGQHRFDLQINKNSTMDEAERAKPAQVMIQIIPHNISLQLGNSIRDPLLGLNLHNVAAVIQNSDSTVIQQRSQPDLATVHETASSDKNSTYVTQINKDDTDTEADRDLEPDANALYEEQNYINGTSAHNQSEKSDVADRTEAHRSGILVARNNEEITRNYSSKVSEPPQNPAITILVTDKEKNENLSITVIKKNRSNDVTHLSETNLPTNHSSYNSSHRGQTFNISDKEHIKTYGTISVTNITHTALNSVTESNSNNTATVSEGPVTDPLKRITELNVREGKGNLTIEEFWRVLQLAKKQLDEHGKNDTMTVNNLITFTQNSNENRDPEQVKHKPSMLFSTDAIKNPVSAMNDTEDQHYDVQRHEYLSRLQDLATELASRANGSFEVKDYFNFTNTTDEISDVTSDEGNNE
ncbi:uncharacterized protein LOC111862963 isoform X3 [Cryptotermes secundus]|uniref:uncharacterized protein LOC111862963 isoform X3 n=1 Tax=Cryptotermes secundus TaxID=105785 RepID=UPI000CD7AFA2|nr:uncharacterized protein LOC111862963 isoform X3 [Cryptotermes secundus]